MYYNNNFKFLDVLRGDDMSIIAENTRRIIKERGLKIGAVGKQAGYQGKTFYNLLSGSKVITDKDIQAIARTLKVTPNELFGIDYISKGA